MVRSRAPLTRVRSWVWLHRRCSAWWGLQRCEAALEGRGGQQCLYRAVMCCAVLYCRRGLLRTCHSVVLSLFLCADAPSPSRSFPPSAPHGSSPRSRNRAAASASAANTGPGRWLWLWLRVTNNAGGHVDSALPVTHIDYLHCHRAPRSTLAIFRIAILT